ncbi:MAG: SDR family NAD(P)-dependent oxidoreductase [Proteobacteria bacterium]|nr:SDR family NAD(P)-dependent oxidoreductase [Pseudomonadota bacterium]
MAGSESPRTLILTGASDGIGRALAIEFAKRGYSLGLIARRAELLETVKSLCLSSGAREVFLEAVDVTDEEKFAGALLRLDENLGGAGFFIANAGVTGRSAFDDSSWPSVKLTLSVNVMAAIHGIELMKVRMLRRGRGTLVGVSSVAGVRGLPSSGAYSSSKAALTAHLESLRVDLLDTGLSVVTVAPGFIDTPLTKKNKGKMPFLMQPEAAAVRFADGIEKRKPFIVAPRPFRLFYLLIQLMPRPVFDFVLRRTYRMIRG